MKRRTLTQNAALHLYCKQMAEGLNDAGFDFKQFLEAADYNLDVPWTAELVKNQLWRPVMQALTGHESTTDMTTIDPTEIHRVVDTRVAELTGVSRPWPSQETLEAEER